MTSRRGAGEGSVYFIESRGLWAATVEVSGPFGKRKRKIVKAKTKGAVLAKQRKLQAALGSGLPAPDERLTTGDWLQWWSTNVLAGTVAPQTEASYNWLIKKYIIPEIGRVKLVRLGPEHVQAMMRSLEAKGLSPRTIAYTRAVLRRSLGHAQRWDKVGRNVAALVDAPRKSSVKLDDALDAAEAAAVLKAASGERLEALATVVLALGLRRGEALRLRWENIDFQAGTLTVIQAKTEAGRRTIAIPAFAINALKGHQSMQRKERMAAAHWDDPGVVFASTIGTPLEARNVLRWWHDLTAKAGVGRRRFHAARHTAATLMLNNGVPLEVVSKTLGHAGLAITADVYARVGSELQRQAADAMQGLLGRA